MLYLSILYRLVRSLLGLAAVLVRRDLSKDAELLVLRARERRAAPPDLAGPLQAGSPGVASLWVPNRSSSSCDLGIFVDQPTEPIATSEAKLW
jgi:hypothetical protein